MMPNQSTPEIDALRSSRLTAEEIYWIAVNHPDDLFAPWDDAIQAVRDTEANVVKRLAAELLSDEAMAAAWCSWASTDEDRNEDAWSGAVAAFIDRIAD